MKKIFFFDLDGTILNETLAISKKLIELIGVFQKKYRDYFFCVATARSKVGLPQVLIDLKKDGVFKYEICSSGATIWKNDELMMLNAISDKDALDLYKYIRELDVLPEVLINGKWYMKQIDEEYMKNFLPNEVIPYIKKTRTYVKDFPSLFKKGPIEKITINYCDESKSVNRNFVSKIYKDFSNSLRFINEKQHKTDIYSVNATKGNAIRQLIQFENLGDYKIICFGDSCEDISMFNVADISVAVYNSCIELKDNADFILKNRSEDGVYKFLLNML